MRSTKPDERSVQGSSKSVWDRQIEERRFGSVVPHSHSDRAVNPSSEISTAASSASSSWGTVSALKRPASTLQPQTQTDSSLMGWESSQKMFKATPTVVTQSTGSGSGGKEVVPKELLYSLYSRAPRRKLLSQEHYYTWHDGGPPHDLRWTAIFICPISAQLFCSLRLGQYVEKNGSYWYKKKSWAEHTAAAHAYNLCMRQDGNPGVLGDGSHDFLHAVPPYTPENIKQEIERKQQQIRTQMDVEEGGK
jgi:hypothetical protein